MNLALPRRWSVLGALVQVTLKQRLAYTLWFWTSLLLRLITMTVFVYFWRGVYGSATELNGLDLQTTLNYILMAQVFDALTDTIMIWEFGYHQREGGIIHILLRPLDVQLSYYVIALSNSVGQLLEQIPTVIAAMLLFGLTWPTDWRVWAAFAVSAFLGRTVMFLFDWILACVTFYTTEVWGLGVLVFGLGLFFSGALVPLAMMPAWLQTLVLAFPFAQTLAVPLQLLSGITPVEQAPRLWLVQLAWIVGLGLAGRFIFSRAIRKVTVQGG
jgi:ABC-2 type transport system permease protein